MPGYIAWVETTDYSGRRRKWYICGDHAESVDWAPERPDIAFRYPSHLAAKRSLHASIDWARDHVPTLGVTEMES